MLKLGEIAISKLTAPMVIDIIKPIAEAGKLETVKRICQRLNNIMTFALNTGVIHNNPLSGISYAFEAPKVRNLDGGSHDFLVRINVINLRLNYAFTMV